MSSRIDAARQQLDARAVDDVDDVDGMPMSAMTMSPARVSAGGSTSGSFGAASVTVMLGFDRLADRIAGIGRQAGRQIDGDDRNARRVDVGDHAFDQAGDRRVEAGAEDRVDDERAVADLGEVQLPRLAVRDFDDGQAEAAENLEIDPRVAADVGDRADEEHRHVDAALHQRARDDEAVAAVVAAAAQHGHVPLEQVAVDRLHGRDDLAAGVLHQHERRDADLLDRPPIGFAHLRGVQHAHRTWILAY